MIGNLKFRSNNINGSFVAPQQNINSPATTNPTENSSKNLIEQYLEANGNTNRSLVNKSSAASQAEEVDEFEGMTDPLGGDYSFERMFYKYGYKFKNIKDFEKTYNQISTECNNNGAAIEDKLDKTELSSPVTNEYFDKSGCYSLHLPHGRVLNGNIDWSKSGDIFRRTSFDDKTFSATPTEHLPQGFDPQKIFENGKSSGLNIDDVHNMGYTGQGVSYAIIDAGVNPHNDLKFKEYNVSDNDKKEGLNDFHGSAVTSIAQEIAPNGDCYFFARNSNTGKGNIIKEHLQSIIEKNKQLPADKKIRVVSMSMPLYGGKESKQLVDELEKQGTWVFYSGCPEFDKIGYLEKKDPAGDINDFNNYQISRGDESYLFVNSGDRTVADPSNPIAYRHDSQASQSWATPVIAGYYVLACQADPSMTKEKFLKLAGETAQVVQSTKPVRTTKTDFIGIDQERITGRTKETVPIKIIDMKSLLKRIEQEKQGVKNYSSVNNFVSKEDGLYVPSDECLIKPDTRALDEVHAARKRADAHIKAMQKRRNRYY